MVCEKCGNEIHTLLVNEFQRDGSDEPRLVPITEFDGAIGFDTDSNWTGYGETEETDLAESVRCPICGEYPLESKSICFEEVVRVIIFKF